MNVLKDVIINYSAQTHPKMNLFYQIGIQGEDL